MESFIPMPTQHDVIPKTAQSKVRLYSGVPWDNSYDHVRLYGSQSALLTALETWRVHPSNDSKLSFTTPVRVGSLEVRLPFTEMEGLEINYLAFQNTGISDTWVFCFVTSIEWLSWNTTQINFELDIWQNNIYKATLKPCFIERSHIPKAEDSMFANLLPENFETGEYIQYQEQNSDFGEYYICTYTTEQRTENEWDIPLPTIAGNMIACINLNAESVEAEGLEQRIQSMISYFTDAGKIDAIIAMFTAPKTCVDSFSTKMPVATSVSLNIGSPFEGYVPKNNKLYQYPYIFIRVDNNLGQSGTYHWEYFNISGDTDAGFTEESQLLTLPTVLCSPVSYKGSAVNYGESLLYNDFPMGAWASDTFRAWMAQNKGSVALEVASIATNSAQGSISSGIGTITSALTGGLAGGTVGAVLGASGSAMNDNRDTNTLLRVGNLLNQIYQRYIQPPTMHGKILQECVNGGLDRLGFTYRLFTIQEQYAKCIDDYWTVFGYPIKQVETPNMNSRSAWNYIKTVGCNIQGDIDLAQRSALRNIFDRGVTIWHTDDVGNYSLANN